MSQSKNLHYEYVWSLSLNVTSTFAHYRPVDYTGLFSIALFIFKWKSHSYFVSFIYLVYGIAKPISKYFLQAILWTQGKPSTATGKI